MSVIKERMHKIVDKLPENFFDDMTRTEMSLMLMKVYLDEYGDDEFNILPGTDKHLNIETLKEMLS